MAKVTNTRVVGIKTSTLAMFEGVFGSAIGLGVAIMYSLRGTVEIAQQTDSVLGGLVFGLSAGIISIIVVPLIYFGLAYVIGLIHGFIFNVVAGSSGGLVLRIADGDKK